MKYLKYLLLMLPLDALAHPGHETPLAAVSVEGLLWVGVVALSLVGLYASFARRARRARSGSDD